MIGLSPTERTARFLSTFPSVFLVTPRTVNNFVAHILGLSDLIYRSEGATLKQNFLRAFVGIICVPMEADYCHVVESGNHRPAGPHPAAQSATTPSNSSQSLACPSRPPARCAAGWLALPGPP